MSPDRSRDGVGGRGSPPASGLRFSPASVLVARALEELARGPRSVDHLARKVLGVRGGPERVTEQLLLEVLEGDRRVERDPAGRWRLAGRAERSPTGALREQDYVVVDVETTGTSPSRGDRVTEIAAVQVSDGAIVGEFSTLVDPERPIPPWISGLTGITDEMVRDAPPFAEVADLVREHLRGRIFVAHNVPFDWKFVTTEMRRSREVMPVGPRLCTLRLSRRLLADLERKGLDSVARHFGVEIEDRHRALGDALATAQILNRLLEEADGRGAGDWEALQAWLSGRPPA